MLEFIQIHDQDNVAVALRDYKQGETLAWGAHGEQRVVLVRMWRVGIKLHCRTFLKVEMC